LNIKIINKKLYKRSFLFLTLVYILDLLTPFSSSFPNAAAKSILVINLKFEEDYQERRNEPMKKTSLLFAYSSTIGLNLGSQSNAISVLNLNYHGSNLE
jgi:hypothetical protein